MEEQKRLFEIIKTKIPEQYRMADMLEELLGVGTDSAYRRIRGEKELSFSELLKICKKFNVSMDEVFHYQSNQGALFQYTAVNLTDQESYINYIRKLSVFLTNLRSAPEKELMFTALDIPFYHFLKLPELLLFKVYVWNDTLTRKRISFKEFYDRLDKDTILPIYDQMANSYMQIPTKEVWTDQTIDTILRLLGYYLEMGVFESKEFVLMLLDQLSQLMDTVSKCADNGHKGDALETPYALYLCSVDFENNYMLTRRGDQLNCLIKLFTINSINTNNELLCAQTEKWINDLMSKSILISGTSSKERFKFFQTSKTKINDLVNKIGLMQDF